MPIRISDCVRASKQVLSELLKYDEVEYFFLVRKATTVPCTDGELSHFWLPRRDGRRAIFSYRCRKIRSWRFIPFFVHREIMLTKTWHVSKGFDPFGDTPYDSHRSQVAKNRTIAAAISVFIALAGATAKKLMELLGF